MPLRPSTWDAASSSLTSVSDASLRLFLAVPIPPQEAARLANYRDGLAELPGARWIPRANMHITIAFLGRVPAHLVTDLHPSFAAAASDVEAAEAKLEGVGGFPRLGRATVFWAGVFDPNDTLTRLAEGLRKAVTAHRLPVDDKPFTPHLTLARFKRPIDLRDVPAPPTGPPWRVEAVQMFSSRPGSGAPIYERIASYPLASSA